MVKRRKITGIYRILNIVNNKLYIGSSVDIKERWAEHKRVLRKNIHHSTHLQNAWNKYGKENFNFEIVEECRECELLIREQYYLDLYKSYDWKVGYNVSQNSSAPMQGRKHSKETLEKLSEGVRSRDSSVWLRGEDSPFAKFKNEDIIDIKKMIYEGEKIVDIAKKYNVESNTITQIKTGERWTHIKTEYDDLIEQTPRQKLTEEEVIEIKKILSENILPIKEIAKMFNVTFGMISSIKQLRSWEAIGSEYNDKLKERHSVRRLNKEKVLKIKELISQGMKDKDIADMFDVARITIYDIKNNRTWKDVAI